MNPTYYIAYTKWINEFLGRWDYAILAVFIIIIASIGFGALCYIYNYWMFKEIWDE